MNRDKTIDSFDVVEPTNQTQFMTVTHSMNQRPSAKRGTRTIFKSGMRDDTNSKYYFEIL